MYTNIIYVLIAVPSTPLFIDEIRVFILFLIHENL